MFEKNEIVRLDQIRSIKQYAYRTAHVTGIFIRLNRYNDKVHEMEHEMARRAGVNTDNHTVYELTNLSGEKLYVMASDSSLSIGVHLEEERW